MRELNFSIPNANKASVGITTALYDRRALDCTSTLPLINSLNNLAYLITSSARIRDILTVDGGVERLVCILKEGRSTKDMMECWKWNLAFQCVVNIGVRGSENVRTRLVEADIVPVIATILDNYVKVIDKCREKADAEFKRNAKQYGSSSKHYHKANDLLLSGHGFDRIRRQAPPPIEIPSPMRDPSAEQPLPPAFSLSSPPERTTFSGVQSQNRGTAEARTPHFPSSSHARPTIPQPLATSIPRMDDRPDSFGLRPVRDADRLPSMMPLPADNSSRPESPTTPSAPANPPSDALPLFRRAVGRRPPARHQASMSQDSDEIPEETDGAMNDSSEEPVVGIQSDIAMQDVDAQTIIEGDSPVRLDPRPTGPPEVDAFDLARSAIEGSISNGRPATVQPAPNITISPIATLTQLPQPQQPIQLNPYARFAHERSASSGLITSMPRDEDVLMCLQLLAYVSKYCNLRSYFQKSHLVPRLKISTAELNMFDADAGAASQPKPEKDEREEEEYLQPDTFNIFPLVEKFTVRHHTTDMQYWAGVVMRNLCRKDDSRGGIRQCAYYDCGKWEEYTRQFAKCRRCRRTKYCSKECQKSAWVYHRHWCVPVQQ
ncbi:uncharacterized protein PV09_05145 [Verruconis gallopava]|uniref:MYND-type zinc finger protein samB n=1 Tax=Verruconis gallopava TaxID=253628 RepID=A0A0D1XMQ4_9PEZI|nr:uncharacterized protein PV09_05145 [Verruconis gallopava]KIW03846.1 hypothetical protein PV09_05145 [Verruconis gallopava]